MCDEFQDIPEKYWEPLRELQRILEEQRKNGNIGGFRRT